MADVVRMRWRSPTAELDALDRLEDRMMDALERGAVDGTAVYVLGLKIQMVRLRRFQVQMALRAGRVALG